ncbi:alkaline phosphatase family protein [Methylobacterium sp. J-072]|uniref:alkaline phosphatase family protein n=1 Tax=Methylobacterium sp. J-072 TaxID=2836651 RepID=UPI001FB96323|nr:alkaline phosphatase family protein [Methylobacterium sp. J-072]MCJ2094541.1 alkaline phosphatase family protein [Methylobacterium sp. J-072]
MTGPRPPADRVVLCVFDGLRPDFVTPERMPNLTRFAGQGTWFREARSVFPSMTRVATTAMATGAHPRVHGIVGNAFYFPQATRSHVLDLGRWDDVSLAVQATGGRFVTAEPMGDVLARASRRMAVVHTGSAGAAYLINPHARDNGHWTLSILGREHGGTPEAVDAMIARFGPLPPRRLPRFEETDYAERVFREHVLETLKPDVALIWFNEPDTAFHYRSLGSPETLEVLRTVDDAFGRIVTWVDAQPDADRYTVIAASDHGQITMRDALPLCDLLRGAGHVGRRGVERTLDGARFVMTGGNMGEIRILEGGAARRDAIARWLMAQSFTGMVFTRGGDGIAGEVPGTFSLSLVDLDHARAPDLVFVLRSDDGPDPFGNPGLGLMTECDVPVGGGMHGGLNRYELNTTLILRGAGLPAGVIDRRPSGIIDIAPTVLATLGLPPAATMTGRSLLDPAAESEAPRIYETGLGCFRQRLASAERNGSRILLHGGRVD